LIEKDGNVSIAEMSQRVGIARKNIENNLKKLKERAIIKRIGSDRGGYWAVVEK